MTKAPLYGSEEEEQVYDCQYDWEDTSVQCGDSGVVFTPEGAYSTAYFEAFPKEPRVFIRGEGKTVQEAETEAWETYQRYVNCPQHEYERKGTNGDGVCQHCCLQQPDVFEPEQTCVICGTPTNWRKSKKNEWYCKEHGEDIPDEDRYPWQNREQLKTDPIGMMFRMLSEK